MSQHAPTAAAAAADARLRSPDDDSRRPGLTLIAAVARNGAIGLEGRLLFNEPADQRHFRQTTLGHPVLMGRRTWDSLPGRFRPLPGRRNLVLSRDPGFTAAGAEVAGSLDEALARLGDTRQVFVLGGAQIYALALPWATRLVLTEVDADLPGDVFFPPWPREAFRQTSRQAHESAAGVEYAFVVYERC